MSETDDFVTLVNRAGDLVRRRDHAAALPLCKRAAVLRPEDAAVHHNLAVVLQALGRFAESTAAFERAAKLAPDNPEILKSLGIARLRLGDWAAGWPLFGHRLRTADYAAVKPPPMTPLWDGAPLRRGTLLLLTEQGAGDTILFARFAARARRRVGRIVLACPDSLARLLVSAPGVDAVASFAEAPPPAAAWCPLMSLPGRLGIGPGDVAMAGPYLSPPEETRARWRDRLPDRKRRRVGLAWRGNPAHSNDHARSMAFDDLRPLLTRDDIDWVGLQVGAPCPDGLENLAPLLTDFAETAAALERLDAVIGVDTAVPHLAGALGRPGCLLLAAHSDWRWGVGDECPPWYPTLRLFRQESPGTWGPAVRAAGESLDRR